MLIELEKAPLRPFVILGHTGFQLKVPVKGCAHSLELVLHCLYVGDGGVLWVNTCLDSIVFGRQTRRVKAHGMKDIIAGHSLIAGIGICQTIVIPMADVQLGAGGIGKHLKHIVLWLIARFVVILRSGFGPFLLPFLFDFQVGSC